MAIIESRYGKKDISQNPTGLKSLITQAICTKQCTNTISYFSITKEKLMFYNYRTKHVS